ncbi:hypothetical protein HDV06_005767 [Boothiomyces sp. JEL0866]|nr:hypothetical protein HDV06_005767 [Boothiomyces sp. JEL0866]
MITVLIAAVAALPSSLVRRTYMDCGNAPYCGVLVLERGDGSGNYYHDVPAVHGLWPETGNYGSSGCLNGDPSAQIPTVSCYTDYSFQEHEWTAHGVCAANDPDTFFNTVCDLSSGPLQQMTDLKNQGYSLSQIASALSDSGYPVFNRNAGNDQLELSACAGSDGVWRLSADFNSDCNF